MMAPPGCKRCLGPEVYHSQHASIAVGLNASCSECGSSIINRSAPRPVIAPPTPAAKYSPPLSVSQRPADLESALNSTLGKIFLYSSASIMLRTLRPNLTANSPVCVVCIIFLLGCLPIIQAGKYVEQNSDFV